MSVASTNAGVYSLLIIKLPEREMAAPKQSLDCANDQQLSQDVDI